MGKHYSSSKAGKRYRVIPSSQGKRQVKLDGTANAAKHFSKKREATQYSKEVSCKLGGKLVIHGRDHKVIKHLNGQKPNHPVDIGKRPESGFGCAKGLIFMSPDFDEPLEEFSDYL
jgi:hypothetical protein